MTHSNDARDALRVGMRAQDHRASRARIYRRRDAGEEPEECVGCGCENDVPDPSHDRRCPEKP